MNATDTSTTGQLLETLRQVTGRPRLDFAAPPSPLAGGFYAEMLRLRLADPPAALDRDLVARIVPNPAAGAWEATVQRQVAQQGFATPTVRLTAPETSPLGRYLIVMDHIDGRPPMAGLGIGTIARQIPNLVRHLPDQLARIAAELHALDPEALDGQLDALDSSIPTTISGFVAELTGYAATLGRPDIAAAGQRLLATEPRTSVRSITHGDLHPFNLLVTADGPVLIDWTVARIAHPAFTLGFAELMLANPPIPLPRAGAALLGPVAATSPSGSSPPTEPSPPAHLPLSMTRTSTGTGVSTRFASSSSLPAGTPAVPARRPATHGSSWNQSPASPSPSGRPERDRANSSKTERVVPGLGRLARGPPPRRLAGPPTRRTRVAPRRQPDVVGWSLLIVQCRL